MKKKCNDAMLSLNSLLTMTIISNYVFEALWHLRICQLFITYNCNMRRELQDLLHVKMEYLSYR